MSDVYAPPEGFSQLVPSMDRYHEIYGESVADPRAFWSAVAERITWKKRWHVVLE